MFNATQMAKPFGQTPDQWLRTQQAKDLIKEVATVHICTVSDLQFIKNGGRNRGTWFQEDVALFFAQWLSPNFYLACNMKLKEIIQGKASLVENFKGVPPLVNEGVALYYYLDVLRSLGRSTRSSAVYKRPKRYPNHFKKLYYRQFCTKEMCQLLEEEGKVLALQQEMKSRQLNLAI